MKEKFEQMQKENKITKKDFNRFVHMKSNDWLNCFIEFERKCLSKNVYVYPSPIQMSRMQDKSIYMNAIAKYTINTYVYYIRQHSLNDLTAATIDKLVLPYSPTAKDEEAFCIVCNDGGSMIQCDECQFWYHYDDDTVCMTPTFRKLAQDAAAAADARGDDDHHHADGVNENDDDDHDATARFSCQYWYVATTA